MNDNEAPIDNVISISAAYASAKEVEPFWPEPLPLPFTLPPVPPMSASMIPSRLRAWLQDIAERMNVPLDFVAVTALVAAGSLVGAKLGVRPQANTTWTEPCNLWAVLVGPPGVKKTPAMSEVLAPLRRLEARAAKAYESELAYHQHGLAVHKLAKEQAERKAKKAVAEGDMITAQMILEECREPKAPPQKRFVVNDATVEKLGEICASNPEGILVVRDELLTLLSDLDATENATARGFFMTGWTGREDWVVDRIGRGTIRIPRVNLSLIGTTQPDRLARYMRSCITGNNDGMAQRLQCMTFPDIDPTWRNVDRHPDAAAREEAFQCFDDLSNLTPEAVGAARDTFDDDAAMPFLRFSPDGLRLFVEYQSVVEPLSRSGELSPELSSHLSKFPGMVARVAMICHLCNGDTGPISAEAVSMALEWAAYFQANAQRAYASLSIDNGEAARAIWKRVMKGDLQDGFTERQIYQAKWSGLGKGPRVTEGLKLLVECDYLAAEKIATGGRPTTVYWINPLALSQPAMAA